MLDAAALPEKDGVWNFSDALLTYTAPIKCEAYPELEVVRAFEVGSDFRSALRGSMVSHLARLGEMVLVRCSTLEAR